jgi:hypothetical protein
LEHFTLAVAAEAADTTTTRIQKLLQQSIIGLQLCDRPTTGSGHARGYSTRRVMQIAITSALTRCGVGPSRAAKAALLFSDQANPGRDLGMPFPLGRTILCLTKHGTRIVNLQPDETLDEHLNGEPAAILDCGRIYRTVTEKLNEK